VSNIFKTGLLLAVLTAMLVIIGGAIGGQHGMVIAFFFALAMNFFSYWFSDKMVLAMYRAQPIEEAQAPALYATVRRLTTRAQIPMPRVYLIPSDTPNAFATGRNPEHAAVAVTEGILRILDQDELEGVLAHELSHVKNRDTLVGTIAATIGGAISFIAQMAQFQMLFGGGGDDDNGGGGFGALVAIILAPIAALIIQLAVSRSREYGADSSGAALTADPEGLAQALEKLEAANKQLGFRGRLAQRMPSRGQPAPAPAANPAFASLYIVNPLSGRQVGGLFSTHPPIEDRVARLRRMALRGWSGA